MAYLNLSIEAPKNAIVADGAHFRIRFTFDVEIHLKSCTNFCAVIVIHHITRDDAINCT